MRITVLCVLKILSSPSEYRFNFYLVESLECIQISLTIQAFDASDIFTKQVPTNVSVFSPPQADN